MTEFKLEAKAREKNGRQTINEGGIPAVVYGKNFDNEKISLEKTSFLRLFREAGTSNLIDLSVGDKKGINTLIHDVQLDPIKGEIIHVDFFKVNMKEKIHAEIPLEFVGDSPAVMNLEGSLITSKDSIEVECLPGDLISEIQVDISVLDDFEKNIKVIDLKVPAGIEIQDDEEEIVAYVQEPRSEEELEALETEVVENVENVEIEEKGKDEDADNEGNENQEEKKSE